MRNDFIELNFTFGDELTAAFDIGAHPRQDELRVNLTVTFD